MRPKDELWPEPPREESRVEGGATARLPALVPSDRARAWLNEMRQFVRDELKEGLEQDFAVIPGTTKPTLLQPGAEKITEKMGLAARFSEPRILVQDNERGEYLVTVHCQLVPFGEPERVIGESWGTAGRTALVKKDQVLDMRAKGLALNTAIKVAQKSAFVGATLKAARLTISFTQDMEDMGGTERPKRKGHFCAQHKTVFFKKGPMTKFGHKLPDGTWCWESIEEGLATQADRWAEAVADEAAETEDIPFSFEELVKRARELARKVFPGDTDKEKKLAFRQWLGEPPYNLKLPAEEALSASLTRLNHDQLLHAVEALKEALEQKKERER